MARTVLITGISGFIAKHTALAFLEAGHRVRGTVRDPAWIEPVRRTLAAHGDIDALEFCEADLLSDVGWRDAAAGSDSVVHVACPDPVVQPKDEREIIEPAVDGSLRVLRAAARCGVSQFVHTSSIFAVMLGHDRERIDYDASDWTDLTASNLTPYARAKTLGERAARRSAAAECAGMRYVSVNPGYVFGPPLDRRLNSSTEMIRMFLRGKYPRVPRLSLPSVDVRDVARLHLAAVEQTDLVPDRLLAVAGSPWMVEFTRAIRERFGPAARRCADKEMGDWMLRLLALVDGAARTVLPQLGGEYRIDASDARAALGAEFVPPLDAALATAEVLIGSGLVEAA